MTQRRRDAEQGQRRLDDSNDWIRREIETALDSNVTVIQVLVEGAGAPDPNELPESIRRLAGLNAFPLADDKVHWDFDVNRLIEKLRRIDPKPPKPKMRWVFLGVGALILVLLLIQFVSNQNLEPVSTSQSNPRSDSVSTVAAVPTENDAVAAAQLLASYVDLTGEWYDDYGNRYLISQPGNSVLATAYNSFGETLGESRGTLLGRTLTYAYSNALGGQDQGRGVLQPDNIHMDTESMDVVTGVTETGHLHKGHLPR